MARMFSMRVKSLRGTIWPESPPFKNRNPDLTRADWQVTALETGIDDTIRTLRAIKEVTKHRNRNFGNPLLAALQFGGFKKDLLREKVFFSVLGKHLDVEREPLIWQALYIIFAKNGN